LERRIAVVEEDGRARLPSLERRIAVVEEIRVEG